MLDLDPEHREVHTGVEPLVERKRMTGSARYRRRHRDGIEAAELANGST
jgi:hypothetical protein